MSNNSNLQAQTREELGTSASRRLRRSGRVPGILYGGGESPVSLSLIKDQIQHAYERHQLSGLITLELDDKPTKVIVRDIQNHPYKPLILHVDFQRVSESEIIRATVPLHVTGEENCPGITQEKGLLVKNLTEVDLECPAGDIPEAIDVDISELHLGNSVHLSELKIPDGMNLVALHGFEDADEADRSAIDSTVVSVTSSQKTDSGEEGDEQTTTDTSEE